MYYVIICEYYDDGVLNKYYYESEDTLTDSFEHAKLFSSVRYAQEVKQNLRRNKGAYICPTSMMDTNQ